MLPKFNLFVRLATFMERLLEIWSVLRTGDLAGSKAVRSLPLRGSHASRVGVRDGGELRTENKWAKINK